MMFHLPSSIKAAPLENLFRKFRAVPGTMRRVQSQKKDTSIRLEFLVLEE